MSDAAFERDKLAMMQHYESQIVALQDEMETLRHDFETERAAFQQLQSGDLAQSIRQELQVGTRVLLSLHWVPTPNRIGCKILSHIVMSA